MNFMMKEKVTSMPKKIDRNEFLNAVKEVFGENKSQITRDQVFEVLRKKKVDRPSWLMNDKSRRISRGVYSLVELENTPQFVAAMQKNVSVPVAENSEDSPLIKLAAVMNMNYVPEVIKGYVPFGNYKDIDTILKSKKFFTVYVTGLSGNGKTMMFEQICAKNNRELVRANITQETDEDDLIGGFRMVNGETVFQPGPVMIAMERGAILLLDEVDLGSSKLMCLQPVLEGKPIFVKKIGRVIYPKPGFNVVATANTKGKGSDDGRFVGTNVMNEAFLERFLVWFEQDYPPANAEIKILNAVLENQNVTNVKADFTERLVKWAGYTRKAFYESGGEGEIISTRRLVGICNAFAIFEKEDKAVALALNRFDDESKTSIYDLWKKLATDNPEDDKDYTDALNSLGANTN